MAVHKCSNCSATLPLDASVAVVRCAYCGTDNHLTRFEVDAIAAPSASPTSRTATSAAPAAGLAGRPGVLVLFVGLVAFAGLFGPMVASIGRGARREPVAKVAPSRTAGPVPPPAAVDATDGGALPPWRLTERVGRGWVTVQTPPISGTLDAFDALANLAWAEGMAKQWSKDARLERIVVNGARRDGTVDTTGKDVGVDYRFYSPDLRFSAAAMARVSETKVQSELYLSVSEGTTEALLTELRGSDDAPSDMYAPRCTLTGVMERAVARGLEQRPVYRAVLLHGSAGWRWSLDGKGTKSIAVVEPDC